MTESNEQLLGKLIERALRTKEPDPHVVARRLMPRLPAEVQADLIYVGLLDHVSKAIHRERSDVMVTRREGVPRWKLAERVCVAGDWKLLAECSADNLFALADDYRARAEQMAQREAEYRSLAQELSASGCSTLGEMWATVKDLAA